MIHERSWAVKYKVNVKSFKKCGVSNTRDGAEGNGVFEECRSQ